MLGTSQYPSPAILADAARASGAEILTVSLRRESARLKEGQDFWRLIRDIGARVLPNTAGCYSVKEAVTTAQMAREVFGTPWVKLEVIGEADTLQPDVFGLVEAARILSADGFEVFPYTTEDLVVAERLIEAGCKVLMPWGAPIGSGKGLNNVFGLRALRAHFPEVPLIVDAGLGLPSHAAAAMELGYDGVLLNTAVAKAGDPVAMARAFGQAIEAGRAAFLAGPMQPRDMAAPSTPVVGGLTARSFRERGVASTPSTPSSTAPPGSRGSSAPARGSSSCASRTRTRRRSRARRARRSRSAARPGATLVVNDYWRVAIDEGAPWVASRPGRSRRRRHRGHPQGGRQARRLARMTTRSLQRALALRARLCRARADLSDDPQGDGLRAAGARAHRRMEAAHRRRSRSSPSAASTSSGRSCASPPARTSSRSSPTSR